MQTLPALARTEIRVVSAALQLAGALDLPAGSCAFEENTCGFDSVLAFLPWILNEEGKGAPDHTGPEVVNFLPCWLAFSQGQCYLGVKSPREEKCESWILFPALSCAARMAREDMGAGGVLCLPGLRGGGGSEIFCLPPALPNGREKGAPLMIVTHQLRALCRSSAPLVLSRHL